MNFKIYCAPSFLKIMDPPLVSVKVELIGLYLVEWITVIK